MDTNKPIYPPKPNGLITRTKNTGQTEQTDHNQINNKMMIGREILLTSQNKYQEHNNTEQTERIVAFMYICNV